MARTSLLLCLIAPLLILLQGECWAEAPVKPGTLSRRSRGAQGSHASEESGSKPRTKRCTCYSYRDKECVYYCHLDIIWINTPERTVPYGMSSYRGRQRLRRAAGVRLNPHGAADAQRCVCAQPGADAGCHHFCQARPPQSPADRSYHTVKGPG